MQKPKLLVLKGLPASGKSTAARKLVEQGWVRSNKDDIRKDKRLFPQGYNRKNNHEKLVIRERDRIINEALTNNKNVVVDDTNLNPVHIKALLNIARQHNAIFEVDDSFLQVPLTECIRRDKERDESVGEQVIRDMFHRYIKVPYGAPKYDPNLPDCYISDIDGTLAHMVNRGPFEFNKVGSDIIDIGVAHVLDSLSLMNHAKVIIFSGRDDSCRPETEDWLERNDVEYENLYMRPTNMVDDKGNKVSDVVVKRMLFKKYILGKYNVLGIFDDRPQVCRMWRDEFGLTVFNLGDPYYEF